MKRDPIVCDSLCHSPSVAAKAAAHLTGWIGTKDTNDTEKELRKLWGRGKGLAGAAASVVSPAAAAAAATADAADGRDCRA